MKTEVFINESVRQGPNIRSKNKMIVCQNQIGINAIEEKRQRLN